MLQKAGSVCLVRNISKSAPIIGGYGPQVSLIEFDPSQDITSQFRSAAQGFDKIIHAGYAYTAADSALEDSVIAGFLEAARETSLSKPVSFIFTTGCLVVGETHTLVGESQTSTANSIELARYRIAHEEVVLAACTENLHTAVIRPGWMYGGSLVDLWFRAVIKHGKIVGPVQDGRVSYIHKEDLGNFYVKVLENNATGVFILSEGIGPSFSELVEITKNVTGVKEVERVENIWEHTHDYGFFLFGLTIHQMLDSERGRLELGWTPKHNFSTEARQLLILD